MLLTRQRNESLSKFQHLFPTITYLHIFLVVLVLVSINHLDWILVKQKERHSLTLAKEHRKKRFDYVTKRVVLPDSWYYIDYWFNTWNGYLRNISCDSGFQGIALNATLYTLSTAILASVGTFSNLKLTPLNCFGSSVLSYSSYYSKAMCPSFVCDRWTQLWVRELNINITINLFCL